MGSETHQYAHLNAEPGLQNGRQPLLKVCAAPSPCSACQQPIAADAALPAYG